MRRGCASVPDPGSISREGRLATFPREALPLFGTVEILWNDHQVPFIEATDERDVPFALGLVHAHLRLGHLEFIRIPMRPETVRQESRHRIVLHREGLSRR